MEKWPPQVLGNKSLVATYEDFPIGQQIQKTLTELEVIFTNDFKDKDISFGIYYGGVREKRALSSVFQSRYYIAVSIDLLFYYYKYLAASFLRSDTQTGLPFFNGPQFSKEEDIENLDLFELEIDHLEDFFRLGIIFIFMHEAAHIKLNHLDAIENNPFILVDENPNSGVGLALSKARAAELMADRIAAHYYANYLLNLINSNSLETEGRLIIYYKAAISLQLIFESESSSDNWIDRYSGKDHPAPQLRALSALAGMGEYLHGRVKIEELLVTMSSGIEAGLRISSWLFGKQSEQRDGRNYLTLSKQISALVEELNKRHDEIFQTIKV